MGKEEIDDIIDGVRSLLKEIKIKPEDFKEKIRGKYAPHENIIEAFRNKWIETDGFGKARAPYTPPGGNYGLDFLGRDFERGRIVLAMEVDSWFRTIGSWQKLADIRAPYKIWIYLARDEKAKKNFGNSVDEIKTFLKSRDEKIEDFGNFIAFMKGPKDIFVEEKIL